MNVITMTAYRRPKYTKEVLIALSKCKGIGNWTFIPNVEPGNDEVISLFHEWDSSPIKLRINRTRLGLNRNTHDVMVRARANRADVVVHIEDDIVLSPDALVYFLWGISQLDVSEKLVLVSGYNKPAKKPQERENHLVGTRSIWTPWGWATQRTFLNWLLRNWDFRNPQCYTCFFRRRFSRTLNELHPLLSRVQNIGYEMGENDRTPEWYRKNHRTNWVANLRGKEPFKRKN